MIVFLNKKRRWKDNMGQYHKFMNFDKKEILEPPSFRKLMEWSYQENEYMLHLENLLKTSWKGDRVLVIGDYVNEYYDGEYSSEVLNNIREENKEYNIENIYHYPYKEIRCSSFYANRLPSRYIYNTETKEYIDIKKQPLQWIGYDENLNLIVGRKIHPLSLVLSCSNGAGGGDYYSKNDYMIGCWINNSNKIILSENILDGDYKELNLIFNEFAPKENNTELLIDFISKNFKLDDLKKVEKLKFASSFFLTEEEKNNIIEQSIQRIKNPEKIIENDLEIEKQKGEYNLNKQLDKKIERLEILKAKELEKIKGINVVISGLDKKLKVLYDFKKQQEKIYQMQQELDTKIMGQNDDNK